MSPPDDVALVGFAELSATVVRTRLLAAHDRFWDVDTRSLHHPVWFDQFGGFGTLARSADGQDVGYLLGVVTADRLAHLHLLAVRDDRRRTGLGRRLVRASTSWRRTPGRASSRRSPGRRTLPRSRSIPRSARAHTWRGTAPDRVRTASSSPGR